MLFPIYQVKDLIQTDYDKLDENETLVSAADRLAHNTTRGFVITSDGEYAGILTKNDLIKGLSIHGKDGKVNEVMSENIESITPEMTLFDVYKTMHKNKYDIVPVKENERFKGIIDMENINEFFLIQKALH